MTASSGLESLGITIVLPGRIEFLDPEAKRDLLTIELCPSGRIIKIRPLSADSFSPPERFI